MTACRWGADTFRRGAFLWASSAFGKHVAARGGLSLGRATKKRRRAAARPPRAAYQHQSSALARAGGRDPLVVPVAVGTWAAAPPAAIGHGARGAMSRASKLKAVQSLKEAAEESALEADTVSGKGQHRGKFVNAHQAKQAKIEAAKKKREEKEQQGGKPPGAGPTAGPGAGQGGGVPVPDGAK